MMNKIVAQYKKYRTRNRRFIGWMSLLLCVTGGVALMAGAHRTGCREIVDLLLGKDTEMSRQIVLNIRLPRILAAIVTGVVLSLSGTVMQILLRNPLASPYTLGISNAAAFGASCCIVFGGSIAGAVQASAWFAPVAPYFVTLFAFAGSLLGLAVILLIVKARRASVETIVLSGVIINSLFGAGIAVMQYLADNVQLASIVFWNFGDLGRGDWDKIGIMLVVLLPALLYFYFKRWDYKVLASGDDYAQSMGVSPQRSRISGLVIASLCTAVAVSFFGVIAFVGLVVPHIVRKWMGENEEFLLTGSVVFGGMFLLLCDTVARTVVSPIVLPVGILTSFLGVPLFLFLLTRKRGG
ncbi:MAG: iron ABC transporter permease [Odoribacter sp.]|nr:iron ABC transporter permease [Odoribacter sp.]